MNRPSNFISLPGHAADAKRSGRFAGEGLKHLPAAPECHSAGGSCAGNSSTRLSSAPAADQPSGTRPRPAASDLATSPLEIALDQVFVNDQILIRTAFSTYVFLVIDPTKLLGLVVGGVFGDYAAEAFLEVLSARYTRRLKVGHCARFHVESDMGRKCITTSVVTSLVYRRATTAQQQ